jgi:sugar O-acyltransferase (sialic acid O-acetyltransferase NeuD family)
MAIYGAGGLGRMVRDILLQEGRVRPALFLDSDRDKHGEVYDGLPVVGGIECLPELLGQGLAGVTVAIGDNDVRVALAQELQARGAKLISAIHPLAIISPSAQLGEHVIVGPRAIIGVHAIVDAHAIVSAGAIVEHDNRIGMGAFLAPAVRLAGGVVVEELAVLEVGACVVPGRRIGRACLVRAGTIAISDVAEREALGGAPGTAEPLRATGFIPVHSPDRRPSQRTGGRPG